MWPITNIYCAGNEQTFEFLKNILTEVIQLFPGQYIHIGGDEANKTEWEKCSKCQARIKKENLKDEKELQSYFIRRIEKFLNKNGRRLLGWDEIIEGGLAANATVMYWRGWEKDVADLAAQEGHDVVMTPDNYCYLNYYQGEYDLEPLSYAHYLPIKKVYLFDPASDSLDEEVRVHIIGGQANLWGEYITSPEIAEYMMLPRLAAMAEVLWTPQKIRDWDNFTTRLIPLFQRYENMDISYAKSAFQVRVISELDTINRHLLLALENEILQTEIRYTLDGSEPTPRSILYTKPFIIDTTTELKTASYLQNQLVGPVTVKKFHFHKAFMKTIKLKTPYDDLYTGGGEYGLTDARRGSYNFMDGMWQGFKGEDFEGVLDLGVEIPVNKVAVSFLQNIAILALLPTSVEIATSIDGKHFDNINRIENNISPRSPENNIKCFSVDYPSATVRYIWIKAKNRRERPPSSVVHKQFPWLLCDEIVVE